MLQFKKGKDIVNVNLECVDYIINCRNGDYKFRFGSGRNATYSEVIVKENKVTEGFLELGEHYFRKEAIVRIDISPSGKESLTLDWGTRINGAEDVKIAGGIKDFIVIDNADGGKLIINPEKIETVSKLFLTLNIPASSEDGAIAFNPNVAEEFLTAVTVTLTDGTPFKLSGKEAIQLLSVINIDDKKIKEKKEGKTK